MRVPGGLRSAILVATLLGPMASSAQFLTGQKLLDLCARHDREDPGESEAELVRDVAGTGTCRGYLMGVADRLEDDPSTGVCIPPNTAVGALLSALRGYADRHPDEVHRPASQVAAGAFHRAYACPSPDTTGRGPPR